VQRCTYKRIEFDGEDLDGLNNARIILETMAQMDELTLGGYNLEQLVEIVEEQASDIAEELEIHFIYDRDGSVREYTPRSLWQPSGGCEWEESASEYDYGWDL
jgi:dsRNA-specific ribonuclease